MGYLKVALGVFSGFRKFIIMVLLIGTAIAFRIKGLVNGAEFVELLKDAIIAFFGVNGVEHVTKAAGEWMKTKGTEEVIEETDK